MRAAPEQLGLSQEQVAGRIGIYQTEISAFELGKRLPSDDRQTRLEQVYGWPAGRVVRLAGLAEEASTLAEFVAGDPRLTPEGRRILLGVYRILVEQNPSEPGTPPEPS